MLSSGLVALIEPLKGKIYTVIELNLQNHPLSEVKNVSKIYLTIHTVISLIIGVNKLYG